MEDHKLQVFCAVIEHESFSRAAEAKFLTQSAISHLIKGLEKDMGTLLVYRHTRAVKPTPAGVVFYQHAKRILSGYKRLTEDIHELMHQVKGPLNIGADATAANYLLPQLIYQFKLAYEEVVIQVSIENPENMVRKLNNGEIDFAITLEKLPEKYCFEEILVEDEVVLIGPENHPLAERGQISPKELSQYPFVLVGSNSEKLGFADVFFQNIGIDSKFLNIVMTTESQNLAIEMVKYGIGLSLVSKWAVFRDIREGAVIILNASNNNISRKFKMIRLEKIPITAVARAFLNFAKNYSFFVPF
jgi:LysR family transcriptional regulator, transcriptional activator of the cysJI operon